MSDNKPCEVENCSGTYVTRVLFYCNLRKVKTDINKCYKESIDSFFMSAI
jgi:pyrrolidone-carboxylate peptidase